MDFSLCIFKDTVLIVIGGTSRDNGLSSEWSSTIKSIDPNAKSITFIPVIYFSLGSGKRLETKEMNPIRIDLK